MTFAEILEPLRSGSVCTRGGFSGGRRYIVRQVPQCIPAQVIPKMTSLPLSGKELVFGLGIDYHDQVLAIELADHRDGACRATSYVPTWEDLFATDWTVC